MENHRLGKCDKEGHELPKLSRAEPATGWNPHYSDNYDKIVWEH